MPSYVLNYDMKVLTALKSLMWIGPTTVEAVEVKSILFHYLAAYDEYDYSNRNLTTFILIRFVLQSRHLNSVKFMRI